MDFWCANRANSACGDFLGICKCGRVAFATRASARFLDGLNVLSLSLASQNPKNPSTILEFTSCKNAESGKKIKSKILIKVFASFCFCKKKSPLYFIVSNSQCKADSANCRIS